MTKKITILGSTGTIGVNTISLIQDNPDFEVVALTANSNVELLAKQAIELNAQLAVIGDKTLFQELKTLLNGTNIQTACGEEGIIEAASYEADLLISGIVGAAALSPTLAAIKNGTTIGLANKECLVCAGDLMIAEVKKHNAFLIPIDSEHNSVFQCLNNNQKQYVTSITLTASGGPFRNTKIADFKHITVEQAIAHPNWNMGAKISVDSATMMNKGLEIIEAYHLFPVEKNQLDIVIHPQSIIHALVNYSDGSTVAGMSIPDMKVPISFALAYPDRMQTALPKLNLAEIGNLTFEKPDVKKFPAITLARYALEAGGTSPAVLNAANEIAVDNFLKKNISFLQIVEVVEETLSRIETSPLTSLEQLYDIDARAREVAGEIISDLE